jgi:flagellar hook-length control protein FliK
MTAANVQQKGGSTRVAIDTNAVALGNSLPATSSFQTRASGAATSPVANDPNPDVDPGSAASGTPVAASQNPGSHGPVPAGSAAQNSAGPSAQTRANARASQAPANTTAASVSAADSDTAAAADDAAADFGSVMATALGRSAAATTTTGAPAKAASSAANSTPAAKPAVGPATDAVAWIAQILMPPAAAAQPGAAAGTTAANTGSATVIGAVTGTAAAPAGVVLPGELAADADTTNDLPAAGQAAAAAAAALGSRINAQPQTQAPSAPSGAAAVAAAPTPTQATVNAMADVQKLISGMTAANATDADPDSAEDLPGAPAPHAALTPGNTDGTAAAAALQASTLTRTDSTLGSATLSIQAPVGSAGFADEVSAGVTGLAQSGITQAQLQLSPADLGPVQVHITLQAGQASVWFGADHADTRAALEQSLPRLRELFAGAGMPLTDSGVFREPPQQQQAQSLSDAGASRTSASATPGATPVTQVSNIRLALLDTYA